MPPLRPSRLRAPLLAAASALVCASSILFAQPKNGEAPLSIHRIVIPPDRLAKELEKVQQGTLISLPLAEFDARLDRVRQAAQARQLTPRLTKASYRAEFVDPFLTNGSGQWTVHQPGKSAAVLPIDPFNLALHSAKWDTGADAILAELDGKSLGLLVKEPGAQTLLFDWSARGTPTNEGLTFNLAIPPCPITAFEFTLPAEYWLTAKRAALVTGPAPTEASSTRLWKVQVTGQGQLELTLRKIVEGVGPAPTVVAQVLSTQSLAGDRVQIDHEFQIEVLHGSVRELILDGDASLEPYEVSLRSGEIKAWQWKEPAVRKDPKSKAGTRGVLTIAFRHPMQGKIQGLKVRSLAPRPSTNLWTSPALQVRDSLSRGETLKLQLHPNLGVGKWDHGTFQVMQAAAESDGTQVITLADASPDAPTARRPAFWPVAAGLDLHTVEHYDWHLESRAAILRADIDYALGRGSLSELRVRLPKTLPQYQLESLEMQPADLLHRWYPSGDFVVLELRQALTSGRRARVKMQLRAAFRELATGTRSLNYPELEPMDSTKRQGTVMVTVDPMLQAQLVNSTLPPSASHDSARGSPQDVADFAFAFRDQKFSATLRLAPRPAQIRWHGQHSVKLADQRASLQFRWEADAIAGAPEYLDLLFAPGFPAGWKLRHDEGTLRVHHWERLPLHEALPHLLRFGARTPAESALLDTMLPAGSHWRFHLSDPMRTKASLVIEASVPVAVSESDWRRIGPLLPGASPWMLLAGAAAVEAAPRDVGPKVWPIPLMTPAQSGPVDQTIAVDSPGEPIGKWRTEGPLAVQASTGKSSRTPNHLQAVQTQNSIPPRAPSLTLWTQPNKRTASTLELCDEARCTTDVHRDGRLTHHIQFRLWHWRDRTCDLRLPPGVRVLAVKLGDHWLDRLEVHAMRDTDPSAVILPVDQNADFVRFEVLASAEAPSAGLFELSKIDAPPIGWPLPPSDLRFAWRLEKGLTPLHWGSIVRVGVPDRVARQTPSLHWLHQLWNWGGSWWASHAPNELTATLENQIQIVLSAESQFRSQAAKGTKLSETLEQFAVHHLKDQVPLVIDAPAFRALGVNPATVLPAAALNPRAGRPFWETLGLVYVPCPGAALLTSMGRLEELGIAGPLQTADLQDAVAEAVLHGHDASGGFFFVLTWLQMPHEDASFLAGERVSTAAGPIDDFHDMTRWEPVSGVTSSASFWVVDAWQARAVGVMLALLTALLLWQFQRALSAGTAFRVLLLVMTASTVIAIWLPTVWREFFAVPILLVQAIGLLSCLIRLLRRAERNANTGASTIVKPAAGAAIVGVLIFMPWMVEAQPPATRSYPVLILEGAKPAALVSPELLAKLDELESPFASGSPEAVLVKAQYAGRIKDATATFDVQYDLHSFKDQASLVIPLAGVQLQEGTFLDGAPVFPTVHKNGYVVPIRAKGTHHLRLSFSVRIVAASDHFDLRFTIPKLAQTEMTLQAPASLPPLQCLHFGGDESTRPGPTDATKEWHAQLGGENVVHLRWANTTATPAPKTIEVREAHCWDLRPSSFSLASFFSYALGNGSVSQLSFTVPDGLHVRRVEAATAPPGPILVKHWQMLGKGAQRRVVVDLAQPVTGQVVLGVEFMAPALANLRKLVLPLPAPLQAKSISGILGYRLNAAEVRSTAQNLAVKNMDADSFEQQWKKQWKYPIPSELRAYSFQRKAQQAGLELVVQPTARQAQMHIRWTVDLNYADALVKATVSSAEDMSILEFSIDPSMTLAAVTGPDVRRWHLQDSLLQIWLNQPRKQTTLELTGWRAFDKNTIQNPKKRFAVPVIYPLQTQLTTATLQVAPARGIVVEAEVLRRLRANPAAKLQWIIEDAPYEAVFGLRADNAPPEATLLTKVLKTEDGIELAYAIHVATERGKLPAIIVRLKDWPGAPMRLDAPGAAVQAIRSGAARESAWSVKYPAGLPQEVRLTLIGRMPMPTQAHLALPRLELEGAVIRSAWCAWTGVDLENAQTKKKLANEPRIREEIINLPGERWPSDLAAWRCAEATSKLTALLPKIVQNTKLNVFGGAEEMVLTDTGTWLHKASFWVQAPESAELRVKFGDRIDRISVFLDRRLHSSGSLADDELTLPLGPGGLVRQVELRWEYLHEAIDAPILALPQIASAPVPASERVLWLPHGLVTSTPKLSRAPTLLLQLMHDAQTHVQVSAALTQEPAEAMSDKRNVLLDQQRAFYGCLRQAEYLTALLQATSSDFDVATWQASLSELRRRNAALAQERGYANQRQAAERHDQGASILLRGRPALPAGLPLVLPADQSALPLEFEAARASAELRARSELILLSAVFLLVFSYFRQGLSLVRWFAPELAAGILLLAMALGGASLIGAVGVAALLFVRLAWLIRKVYRRRQMLTTDFDISSLPVTKSPPAP